MKASRVILIIVIALFLLAITIIVIKLRTPSGNNSSDLGTGNTGGGNTGTGNGTGSGSGNNTPPPPPAIDWTTFKVGDRAFAVVTTNAWSRDTLGTNGYLAHTLKSFAPGSYIGTVSAIIPGHGLMLKNSSLGNPNLGDAFFVLGLNGAFRKG